MMSDFDTLVELYDSNHLIELIHQPNGIYWLKLRSLSRTFLLRHLCEKIGIDSTEISSSQLFSYVYHCKPQEQEIDDFIRALYEQERNQRHENEDALISELYQMKTFDWGGLYQNSLERTIVDNYVKRIRNWGELNGAIENEIHTSMQGYVRCSWYNHWTSIIIEDI